MARTKFPLLAANRNPSQLFQIAPAQQLPQKSWSQRAPSLGQQRQPHHASSPTLTSLTAGTSEAQWAPAAEAASTIEAGGSILTRVGETFIHI